ncbi:alpha/beta hydrolase [Spirochaetota bacterium]
MTNSSDYKKFDNPSITSFIFHPRSGHRSIENGKTIFDINIPIDTNIQIGARYFKAENNSPTVLFFHGNGEIVDDYNDLGQIYTQMGINFLPVDYRGYGNSTGTPTVSTMMSDSHSVFKFIKNWLNENNMTGPLIVMGRSLGSAPALELAYNYFDEIDALIIESGFAYIVPLLKLLGINTDAMGINDDDGIGNKDKIKVFTKPALIIHAEFDHIIPFKDGKALYDTCPSKDKQFLKIPDANHNTIFAYGINEYMAAIKNLAQKFNT